MPSTRAAMAPLKPECLRCASCGKPVAHGAAENRFFPPHSSELLLGEVVAVEPLHLERAHGVHADAEVHHVPSEGQAVDEDDFRVRLDSLHVVIGVLREGRGRDEDALAPLLREQATGEVLDDWAADDAFSPPLRLNVNGVEPEPVLVMTPSMPPSPVLPSALPASRSDPP